MIQANDKLSNKFEKIRTQEKIVDSEMKTEKVKNGFTQLLKIAKNLIPGTDFSHSEDIW